MNSKIDILSKITPRASGLKLGFLWYSWSLWLILFINRLKILILDMAYEVENIFLSIIGKSIEDGFYFSLTLLLNKSHGLFPWNFNNLLFFSLSSLSSDTQHLFIKFQSNNKGLSIKISSSDHLDIWIQCITIDIMMRMWFDGWQGSSFVVFDWSAKDEGIEGDILYDLFLFLPFLLHFLVIVVRLPLLNAF